MKRYAIGRVITSRVKSYLLMLLSSVQALSQCRLRQWFSNFLNLRTGKISKQRSWPFKIQQKVNKHN